MKRDININGLLTHSMAKKKQIKFPRNIRLVVRKSTKGETKRTEEKNWKSQGCSTEIKMQSWKSTKSEIVSKN